MKKLSAMVMAGVMALGMVGCGSTAAEAVSYTHLDVYKRQVQEKQPVLQLPCRFKTLFLSKK